MSFERTKGKIKYIEINGFTANDVLDIGNLAFSEARKTGSDPAQLAPGDPEYLFSAIGVALANLTRLYDSQCDRLPDIQAGLKSRIAKQTEQLRTIEKDLTDLSARVEACANNESKIKDLNRQIGDLTAKYEAISGEAMHGKRMALDRLQKEYKQQQAVFTDIQEQLAARQSKSLGLAEQLAAARQEILAWESAEQQLVDSAVRLESWQARYGNIEQVKEQLRLSQTEVDGLEAQLLRYENVLEAYDAQKLSKEAIADAAEVRQVFSDEGKSVKSFQDLSDYAGEKIRTSKKILTFLHKLIKALIAPAENRSKEIENGREEDQ